LLCPQPIVLEMRRAITAPRFLACVSALGLLFSADGFGATSALPTLTTTSEVHRLTYGESLRKYPIHLREAQVLYYNPTLGNLFVRDSSGGLYIDMRGQPQQDLAFGALIEVKGETGPGGWAPVITKPHIRTVGWRAPPPPPRYSLDHLLTGMEDSQWIEIEGVVRSVEESSHVTAYANQAASGGANILVAVATGAGRIDVIVREAGGFDYSKLIDAKVVVRGVCGPRFNQNRQLTGIHLFSQSLRQFRVVESSLPDPFSLPIRQLNTVMRYTPDALPGHRIRVRGVVTANRDAHYLSISERGQGLFVRTSAANDLSVGDVVDVVGFPVMGDYSPVLEDVVYRKIGTASLPTPITVTSSDMLKGVADAQLVRVQGRLLQRTSTPQQLTLLIVGDDRTFSAVLPASGYTNPLVALRAGSTLEVTGTCIVDVFPDKTPRSAQVLLRSPEDVVVIHWASWWTATRTAAALVASCLVLFAALIWVMLLRRHVKAQHGALQKAIQEASAFKAMARAMQEVTTERRFTARVHAAGSEQLVQLGIGLNRMLAELEKGELAKKEAEEELQRQALTDELTDLPNRRLLADRLAQSVAIARREQRILALLYLDLDGFKLVNDSLGHRIGDLLLAQVANRLRSKIRQADTFARLGGDEFTIVLTFLRSVEDAQKVALSLLEALSDPFTIEGHEISIGASVGISLFPKDATNPETLLQQADSAMYAAKRNGKNQAQYFTAEIGLSAREQMSLENQLRGAIGRGEIHLEYQPEFDLATGKLIRFEALARWTHPVLGRIPPSKFIRIAEESGQIISLGLFVLQQACDDAVRWQRLASNPVGVAVNVSSLQFERDGFVDSVAELLKRSGLNPGLLQIELTESIMLRGAGPAAEVMKRLRELGVTLAIDDFGTGYSCLGYLPGLPFNLLKIDRSFVREMEKRSEARAVVRSLVTLAKNLQMQVVLEGVETPQQLEAVKQLGGNAVQGFLLGKPTSEPETYFTQKVSIFLDRPDRPHTAPEGASSNSKSEPSLAIRNGSS